MVKTQNKKPSNKIEGFGATGGIRTPDLPEIFYHILTFCNLM